MARDYRVIVGHLRSRIEAGEFGRNGKLPTEEQLMEQYGSSRYGIRKALGVLADTGVVFAMRGSGVYVRDGRENDDYMPINSMRGLSSEYAGRKVESIVRELSLLRATPDIAQQLRCNEGDQVWKVVRIRLIDGEPRFYERSWFPKDVVPYLDLRIAEGSLFGYARNVLGLHFGYADKVFEVCELDADTAKELGLEEGQLAPCLSTDAFLDSGRLFNSSVTIGDYRKVKFFARSSVD
ncbi:GntR family transcriptional regulator [Bifidobacterium sp. MA2]|uniref:GntR family transcriptional regulator n=1 Tax=Bifidobacterium santillanense TaxID=2809028 RepID=A0ABS5UR84_9BIFI|nr:GntR family transcriptional regulator [Bifidobacterium santillanense]MBT1173375.1 GntR family transcriptional regulator [Bifidobacterium santillanense]